MTPIYVTSPSLPPLEEFIPYLEKIWESKWLTNVSGVIKLLIAAGIIISAIIYISRGNAAANDFSMASFIPKLGDSFIFFPALIYNFLGFEVMSAMGGQMKNPKKDVPRAVISNAFGPKK